MAKDRLVPCLIHIPCLYPDGTEIEADKLNQFFEIFDRQFNGSTPLGVVQGHWEGMTEPMLRIEVAVKKSLIPQFEKIAKRIGRETKQQAMYVVINYRATAQILFIDYEDDGEQSLGAAGGN